MAKKRNSKNRSFNKKTNVNIEDLQSKIENLELLNGFYSASIPRNLSLNAVKDNSITILNRDVEYMRRHEMYEDTFVREMVKVIIVRAIGTTHDNVKPFEIDIKDNAKIDENFKEILKKEFEYLTELIDDRLMDIVLDSQFFGDGYCRIVFEKDKGVTDLLMNYSTKPFNIIPIVTNQLETIAYEVTNNYGILNTNNLQSNILNTKNNRYYVAPINIGRVNSKGNGIIKLTQDQLPVIENLNVFSDQIRVYEDSVYGGVVEGCYEDYISFKWALKALANTRIANSVVERFIIHNLSNVSDNEKRMLKNALETQIKNTMDAISQKVTEKSPDILIANHIIPTTGDGTNSISIQESNPNFSGFQSIEDIMIHIKKFIGAIGFNYELTSFGGSVGGGERDGVIQNSLQMDAQGTQIRKAIRNFVLDVIKTHFLAKYNLEIDLSQIEVNFRSVLNQAKLTAEQQRMENITNSQQVLGIVQQFKEMNLEDNETNRIMVRSQLEDMISQTTQNKDIVLESWVNYAFTKEETQENNEEI